MCARRGRRRRGKKRRGLPRGRTRMRTHTRMNAHTRTPPQHVPPLRSLPLSLPPLAHSLALSPFPPFALPPALSPPRTPRPLHTTLPSHPSLPPPKALPAQHAHTPRTPRGAPGNLNYGRFKRNNFNICSKSWNYRGCWHQTCPLLAFSVVSVHRSFYGTDNAAPLVLLVTTSDVVDWVVCAPAAFLRSMKHVSCSFSGVEPKSSVTRHHHRSPLYYG